MKVEWNNQKLFLYPYFNAYPKEKLMGMKMMRIMHNYPLFKFVRKFQKNGMRYITKSSICFICALS